MHCTAFLVATDHWNLTRQEKDVKKKLATYMLEFARYPIKGTLPIEGSSNNAPDFLSRMYPPDPPISNEKEEERQGHSADTDTALGTAEKIQEALQQNLNAMKQFTAFYRDGQAKQSPKQFIYKNNSDENAWSGHLLNKQCECNIISYGGESLNHSDLNERYGTSTAPYAVATSKDQARDASLDRSVGSLANHNSKPNARLSVYRGNVTLKAIKPIRNGDEITVNYGIVGNRSYKFNDHTHRTTRMHNMTSEQPELTLARPQRPPQVNYSEGAKDEIFHSVHSGNGYHFGTMKTWELANDQYPGHGMSHDNINSRIQRCPDCQKHRLGLKAIGVMAFGVKARDADKQKHPQPIYVWRKL